MNLDERLEKDNRNKKPVKDPYYDDEPDYAGYIEYKKRPFLNEDKGVFEGVFENSFNKEPDVFDRTAVFRTSERSRGIGE